MKTIPLTRNYVCWVDDEDYPVVAPHRWHAVISDQGARVYAARFYPRRTMLYMHRLILGVSAGETVDHRSHSLAKEGIVDNRRTNLRLATTAQNAANLRKTSRVSSVFKGVAWSMERKRWVAQIKVGQRTQFLGRCIDEANAAYLYDLAAVRFFGDYALTNFPVPGSPRSIFGGRPEVCHG